MTEELKVHLVDGLSGEDPQDEKREEAREEELEVDLVDDSEDNSQDEGSLGRGYHLGIVDDPIDPEKARSLTHQKKFQNWWTGMQ